MNIYVGNIAYELTEDELKQEFEAFGSVNSVSIIKDKFSGQPRGFGFVEMPSADEAKNAINSMNGKDLGGQSIRVNEARPKEDRPRDGGGRRFGGSGMGGGRGGFGGDRRRF